ncbi:hypothetical protein CEXT_401911 [Caerostris extrusa]|uniref:Uncharacterized protein n=1 Tax=Caerostris extrusa TaxID=172846 RepID=A0AAV4TFD6_CAEEX|nr:hypothetical protein CEXT_401911 [Caerostris extrusa]
MIIFPAEIKSDKLFIEAHKSEQIGDSLLAALNRKTTEFSNVWIEKRVEELEPSCLLADKRKCRELEVFWAKIVVISSVMITWVKVKCEGRSDKASNPLVQL